MKTSTNTIRSSSSRPQVRRKESAISTAAPRELAAPSHDKPAFYEVVFVVLAVVVVCLVITVVAWRGMTSPSNNYHKVTCQGEFHPKAIADEYGEGLNSVIEDAYTRHRVELPGDMDSMVRATLRLNHLPNSEIGYHDLIRVPICH